MSLDIKIDKQGDAAVLQCIGRIVRDEALDRLKDAVCGQSQLRVTVLDLSRVSMIDARGVGMLVSLHKWAGANYLQLKLVNPSKVVREVLERTGLMSVLHISSLDDVVEMFCRADRTIDKVNCAVA